MSMHKNYKITLKNYLLFLKNEKKFYKRNIFKYENTIEKIDNWTDFKFSKNLLWYNLIKKNCKAKISKKHLEKLENWKYDKNKGRLFHTSGGFFSIEGYSIKNAGREVNKWDQPFIKQNNLVGGIIGLVRTRINQVPHYLIEGKYEPGNYNMIQLSPSVQSTYSNLNQKHKGERNKIIQFYFKKGYKTLKKVWVSEDGGRLFKKRNLHWIIESQFKNIPLEKNYKWLSLWEIEEFINKGTYVGPHLRAILSLI